MLGVIFDWIRGSREAQGWADPVTRITFFATIFFTLLTMWGTHKQRVQIREARSGDSVSMLMLDYMSWLFLAYGYFGFEAHTVSSTFNGLCAIFYFLAFWEIKKYKKYAEWERKLSCAFPFMPLVVVLMPSIEYQELATTILLFGSLPFIAMQPWKMYQSRNAGSVSLAYTLVFMSSVIFWTVFAYKTQLVPLLIVNPLVFLILCATVYFWFKYQKPSAIPARVTS